MELAKLKNYRATDNTRLCKSCKLWLDLSQFGTRVIKDRIQVRERCKKCAMNRVKLDKYGTPEYRKMLYRRNIKKKLYYAAKDRAKTKGLEFNITIDDIVIPERCPLLNIELLQGDKNYTPSLDRIDNTKGYIKDNVWIISSRANSIKRDASLEELQLISVNLYLKVQTEKQ